MTAKLFLFSLIPPAAGAVFYLFGEKISSEQSLFFSILFLILWWVVGMLSRSDKKHFAKAYFCVNWTLIVSLILIVVQWISRGNYWSSVWSTVSTFCFRAAKPVANWFSGLFSQIFVSSNIWFIHVVSVILLTFLFWFGFSYIISLRKRK